MRARALRCWSIAALAVTAVAAGISWALWSERPAPEDCEAVARPPRINPDYAGIVVPPNIAPLNFAVREDGERFFVRISGEAGEAIEVWGRSPAIVIPPGRWRTLLHGNRGKDLRCDVYAEAGGQWRQYQSIVNHVAEDDIDEYLVYRRIAPVHTRYREVAVHQRRLASYEDSPLLDGKSLDEACVNCHSFAGNDPQRMLIGIRRGANMRSLNTATLLAESGRVTKLAMPFGYTAWHPSGRIAVYSTNKVRQFRHSAASEVRDVIDLESALAYFRVDARQSKRVPGASGGQHLSTYPAWSPDGKSLYYCQSPVLWTDREAVPPERYAEVKYSLMRMSYDVDADAWGDATTVLSAEKTGLSILLPRISPDGRFLLFCMCRYGCFPAFQPTSDLYMMDLKSGTYAKCAGNSEFSESWHSWSSNSRWIAFSSKRQGGLFTRCYLSFVDPSGEARKPFVVPQSDPEFYDSFLQTMSVPELLAGPVPVSSAVLLRAARSQTATAVNVPSETAPKVEDTDPYR